MMFLWFYVIVYLYVNLTEGRDKAKIMNENSMANLVLYQPGQSGNPAGMKPGTKQGLRAHFNRILNKRLPSNVIDMLKLNGLELEDETFGEVISYVVAVKAAAGDLQAAKLITDTTEAGLERESTNGDLQKLKNNGGLSRALAILEDFEGKRPGNADKGTVQE